MIYFKLEDEDLKVINEIKALTINDYEMQDAYIPVENLLCVIEDLLKILKGE